MKRPFVVLAAVLATGPVRAAGNLDQINLLAQPVFLELSQDLSAATSYKGVTPAAPLGITGLDVGVEVTAVDVAHRDAWQAATSGTVPGTVYVPKLSIDKGLPLGIDIGGFYGSVPNSNVRLWGAEARYAILEGGATSPALAVRAAYTKLEGVDQLDFHTSSAELLLSKGFAVLTPYAGLGRVWATSTPVNVPYLSTESFTQDKYLLGLNLNLGFVNVAVEGDKTGDTRSYTAKVGLRF